MIPTGIEHAAEELARIRKEREVRLFESELSGEEYVITTNRPGELEAIAEYRGVEIVNDGRNNPDYEFRPDGKSVNGNSPDYDGPIEVDRVPKKIDASHEAVQWARRYEMDPWQMDLLRSAIEKDQEHEVTDKLILFRIGSPFNL